MVEQGIKFGYWAAQGRGQTCRLLLEYTGVKYTEERYTGVRLYYQILFIKFTYINRIKQQDGSVITNKVLELESQTYHT
jgi:hypothetical protein